MQTAVGVHPVLSKNKETPLISDEQKVAIMECAIQIHAQRTQMPIAFVRALYYSVFIPVHNGIPHLAF